MGGVGLCPAGEHGGEEVGRQVVGEREDYVEQEVLASGGPVVEDRRPDVHTLLLPN